MLPEEITFIRQCLPEPYGFPYHPDRESPWLLSRQLTAPSKIAVLRGTRLGKFLDRPAVRPIVAACGGVLAPDDLRPAALPEKHALTPDLSRAAEAGLTAAFAQPWQDFEMTLTAWGTQAHNFNWSQMSRRGGNLVLQMGFPSDHGALMGRYLGAKPRKEYEYTAHPIRQTGRPTLAWARLDIDLERGEALIEEVQSDWLRFVREDVMHLDRHYPRSRELRVKQAYEAELRSRYGKVWPKAMLLATLRLLAEDLGIRSIWMHQPEAGYALKGIWGQAPPVSLYTALPKSFGFLPTDTPPQMLRLTKRRSRKRLNRVTAPHFWRIDL